MSVDVMMLATFSAMNQLLCVSTGGSRFECGSSSADPEGSQVISVHGVSTYADDQAGFVVLITELVIC